MTDIVLGANREDKEENKTNDWQANLHTVIDFTFISRTFAERRLKNDLKVLSIFRSRIHTDPVIQYLSRYGIWFL